MENKPTLLYVDDEPINLKLFAINFRKKFEVITCESPFEGLVLLKSSSRNKCGNQRYENARYERYSLYQNSQE